MLTLLKWIILLPVLLAVLLLAMANDQTVTINLNPFDPGDPVLRAEIAVYQFGFVTFVLGALIGGFVDWASQRKYRRQARLRRGPVLDQPHAERSERAHAEAPSSAPTALLPRPQRG